MAKLVEVRLHRQIGGFTDIDGIDFVCQYGMRYIS